MNEPSQEDLEKAEQYKKFVIHEVEQAVIGEVEKMEGRVPNPQEMYTHGKQVLYKNADFDVMWKGRLICKVQHNQINDQGQRGTKITTHAQLAKEQEKTDESA